MKQFIATWEGKELEIAEDGDYIIGRNPGSDIFVSDRRLSREHAKISSSNGKVTVEDLGSSNGTLLNNKLLETPTALKNKDKIVAGPVNITIKVIEKSEAVEATLVETHNCPDCGFAIRSGAKFCPGCGRGTQPAAPAQAAHTCKKCGGELAEGAMFCPGCGHSIKEFFVEKLNYADIGPRSIAGIIDGLINAFLALNLVIVPWLVGMFLDKGNTAAEAEGGLAGLLLLIGIIVYCLVMIVLYGIMWGVKGASVGMKFTNIRLISTKNKRPIGFMRGVIRLLLFSLVPGWLLVFMTAHRQALHDLGTGSFLSK